MKSLQLIFLYYYVVNVLMSLQFHDLCKLGKLLTFPFCTCARAGAHARVQCTLAKLLAIHIIAAPLAGTSRVSHIKTTIYLYQICYPPCSLNLIHNKIIQIQVFIKRILYQALLFREHFCSSFCICAITVILRYILRGTQEFLIPTWKILYAITG